MKKSVIAICMASLLASLAPAPAAAAPLNPNYEIDKAWAQLPADMPWNSTTPSVAADGKGNVHVMVRAAPFIRVFNREGKFIRTWGGAAFYSNNPHGVMFDRDGNIWTTDAAGHAVYKFDANGEQLMMLGKKGAAGDNTIYVSEVSMGTINVIKDGKLVEAITGLGRPHGITMDTDGAIYAADAMGRTVTKITKKK